MAEWEITDEQIFANNCDSTGSQTGKNVGSIKLFQEEVNHPVLWLICRRHIMELHVKHAKEAIIGSTTSPFEPLFQHFQQNWNLIVDNIDYSNLAFFKPGTLTGKLSEDLEDAKFFVKTALSLDVFPRDDYKELTELIEVFLTGKVHESFSFKRPGANHHARFMSKSIYFIKLTLLMPQVENTLSLSYAASGKYTLT